MVKNGSAITGGKGALLNCPSQYVKKDDFRLIFKKLIAACILKEFI
jgi:hypothetical protein